MEIALVCYMSESTYWISKYIVDLEKKLNEYIKTNLEVYSILQHSFYMGILYYDKSGYDAMLARKVKYNKSKKYYEFDVKYLPNEFIENEIQHLNDRILEELLINLEKMVGDEKYHKVLLNCLNDFRATCS
jgi:hypothetical protein